MKQRTKKRCFMIIALSLAALFLVNNASLVYAYEDQLVVPEFKVVATIENDKGESYDLQANLNIEEIQNDVLARANSNINQQFKATVAVDIPYNSVLQSLIGDEDYDSSITAYVQIYFYLKNYPNSEIGILVTKVGCSYTMAGDGSVLNRIQINYACNGAGAGFDGLPVTDQTGSATRYSAFQLSTGFDQYVSRDDPAAIVHATAKYYLEDMHNSWVTTVKIEP